MIIINTNRNNWYGNRNAFDTEQNESQLATRASTDGITVIGSENNDLIIGTFRNDVLEGRGGADVLKGGEGIDTASYDSSASGVKVNLGGVGVPDFLQKLVGAEYFGFGFGGDAAGDRYYSIENVLGSKHDDLIIGNAEDNTLDGNAGLDTVSYNYATQGVFVQLADGVVTGGKLVQGDMFVDDGSVGTDTLRRIESVRGTEYDDVFDARGFGKNSTNAGDYGKYNVFEGGGGNDTIFGNGSTVASYEHAKGPVLVDLAAGTAQQGDRGPSSVGYDALVNVNAVKGSAHNDQYWASNKVDTFVFGEQIGHDTIHGFNARGGNHDVIRFEDDMPFDNFRELRELMEQVGNDVVISIDGHNSITLAGVNINHLDSSDFLFA